MLTRDEAEKLGRKVIGFSTFPGVPGDGHHDRAGYTRFANNGITTAALQHAAECVDQR